MADSVSSKCYKGQANGIKMKAHIKQVFVGGKLNLMFKLDAAGNKSFRAFLDQNNTIFPQEKVKEPDDIGAMYYVVAVILLYGLSIIFMIGSVIKKSKSDHGLSKYMRDLDKVKRLERRQEKFKARMAMQRKRGRYAKTARPLGSRRTALHWSQEGPSGCSPSGSTSDDCSTFTASVGDIYESQACRPLIMPKITVEEVPPGTPAPWSTPGQQFQFPPIYPSYTYGKRKPNIRTRGTSIPDVFELQPLKEVNESEEQSTEADAGKRDADDDTRGDATDDTRGDITDDTRGDATDDARGDARDVDDEAATSSETNAETQAGCLKEKIIQIFDEETEIIL